MHNVTANFGVIDPIILATPSMPVPVNSLDNKSINMVEHSDLVNSPAATPLAFLGQFPPDPKGEFFSQMDWS